MYETRRGRGWLLPGAIAAAGLAIGGGIGIAGYSYLGKDGQENPPPVVATLTPSAAASGLPRLSAEEKGRRLLDERDGLTLEQRKINAQHRQLVDEMCKTAAQILYERTRQDQLDLVARLTDQPTPTPDKPCEEATPTLAPTPTPTTVAVEPTPAPVVPTPTPVYSAEIAQPEIPSYTSRALPPNLLTWVEKNSVIAGDIRNGLNNKPLYDNNARTGLVTRPQENMWVIGHWGGTISTLETPNDSNASQLANVIARDMLQTGCGTGIGCPEGVAISNGTGITTVIR